MSIFKETFPKYIRQQIKIREKLQGLGINENGRMGSVPFGDSGLGDKYNDKYGDVTIDAGAFHSYNLNKLCTIRMSSGVNLSKHQTILEGGKYEKEKHLLHEGLAQRYILEGGSPIGVKNKAGDLVQAQPMQRLLQGDVGSGKTAVAIGACDAVLRQGLQCALMAPTEILAEQHYMSFKNAFTSDDEKIGLLTASTKTAARRIILENILNFLLLYVYIMLYQ